MCRRNKKQMCYDGKKECLYPGRMMNCDLCQERQLDGKIPKKKKAGK